MANQFSVRSRARGRVEEGVRLGVAGSAQLMSPHSLRFAAMSALSRLISSLLTMSLARPSLHLVLLI